MLFDYFRNGVMNALLQGRSFTFPSNLYFALLTTWPDTDATGSTIAEPQSGNGYARQQLNPSTSNYANTSGGVSWNAVAQQFPTPTGGWNTIVGVALVDGHTTAGGNAYMAGLIGLGAIGAGSQPPTFPAGTIVFELGSRDP